MTKALLKAASAGKIDKLTALLADGADINYADKMPGRTALIEATIASHAQTVRFLIAQGANVNLTDQALGNSALAWSAYNGDLAIAQQLLAAGALVDITNSKFQLTPLMTAAQQGKSDVVQLLIKAGANLNLQTGNGRNALSMAEANRHLDTAILLKQLGAILPTPIQETALAWPEVNADLSNVDFSNPASVLRGFILAMYQWEIDCEQHRQSVGNGNIDWQSIKRALNAIIARFCTPKLVAEGGGGSFSATPNYTPALALAQADIKVKTATLMTRQPLGGVLRYEKLFSLVNNNKLWQIDGIKHRPWGTEKWARNYL
ncbi:MAG: ankyrin repeat domain-containing protein [Methylophilaceae bacterium]